MDLDQDEEENNEGDTEGIVGDISGGILFYICYPKKKE